MENERTDSKDYSKLSKTDLLNNALLKVKDEHINTYYLTESFEEANDVCDKIFKELPSDIPFLELQVLKETFTYSGKLKVYSPFTFNIIKPHYYI